MLREAFIFVLETVVHLFVLAVLLRFYAQAFRAPFRNPLTDFIVALTDWIIKPMRRLVPGILKLDIASFIVAWFALACLALVAFLMRGNADMLQPLFWPGLLFFAFVAGVKLSLYLLIGVLIVQAVLSWVSPYHPMRPFFDALSRPFMRPVQRVLPLIGGVDLSPLVVLIVVQVLLMVPIAFLERLAVAIILHGGG
jgi:YggT family protein